MSKLNIFISSTCYDLTKERVALKETIEQLGHNVIVSESIYFPIDPSKDTINNCIDIVRNEADLLILLIKDRYGYIVPHTGRSITHMEFQTALDKGIPIYTFTYSETLRVKSLLKNQVDDDSDFNKVCQFIDEIRGEKSLWNFEYSNVNNLADTIKTQLSILLKHSLIILNRVEAIDKRWIFPRISSEAYRLLVYKKKNYVEQFFLQAMKDEMDKHINLKLDYNYAMALDLEYTHKHPSEFVQWFKQVWNNIIYYLESDNKLSKAFFDSYKGENSDFRQLYYVSKRFADLYADLLDLGIHLKSEKVYPDFANIQQKILQLVDNSIEQLESYPKKLLKTIALNTEGQDSSDEDVKEYVGLPGIFLISSEEIDEITKEVKQTAESFQKKSQE